MRSQIAQELQLCCLGRHFGNTTRSLSATIASASGRVYIICYEKIHKILKLIFKINAVIDQCSHICTQYVLSVLYRCTRDMVTWWLSFKNTIRHSEASGLVSLLKPKCTTQLYIQPSVFCYCLLASKLISCQGESDSERSCCVGRCHICIPCCSAETLAYVRPSHRAHATDIVDKSLQPHFSDELPSVHKSVALGAKCPQRVFIGPLW